MTAAFAPGFYTTSADAASVSGDWRLAGWTPKVLRLPDELGAHARREVLLELGRALGAADPVLNTGALDAALGRLEPQTVVVWARGAAFADEHAAVWSSLADVFVARARRAPAFAVVLAGADKKSKERDR
ncbi:MAG: hypothetical protein QM708_06075 [Propioniciclava sp.]|uniref:hypothetical protein n=1 Tax=Propioniciclava sp. TaxID=2038686 RepID=UPI0039E48A7D